MREWTEPQYAEWVVTRSDDELIDLLREEHPVYAERGSAAVGRMRGWVLLTLARGPLAEGALPLVLEELETGVDPYLVAAAARTLRLAARPAAAFAPFLIRALVNMRTRDDPVCLTGYGNEAGETTSPLTELFAALEWLGPHARRSLPELESLRRPSYGLPRELRDDIERLEGVIRDAPGCCCGAPAPLDLWSPHREPAGAGIDGVRFEDHDGAAITFGEFFTGRPTVVIFFYTRCDNPQKCSLAIAKLARVQQLLAGRGLGESVRTAAITYDPEYDLAARMRAYGTLRGLRLGPDHRMLRAVEGFPALRSHFRLGVNFVRSLVNRHRLEVFVLGADGRVVGSFQRLQWSEAAVVEEVERLTPRTPRTDAESPAPTDSP